MIHEAGYLGRFDDLRWYAWTPDAVRLLNRAGFVVCVTTNQGGIGLGFYTEAFLREVHARMASTLESSGARVDGWFYCPHHPAATVPHLRMACDCRKPRAGMIRQAVEQFGIDPHASFVVGDKLADIGLAQEAGARGILVRTGYGADTERAHGGVVPGAACVANDLMGATAWILEQTRAERAAAS